MASSELRDMCEVIEKFENLVLLNPRHSARSVRTYHQGKKISKKDKERPRGHAFNP